jgi:S-adenosylmethionine synthetase
VLIPPSVVVGGRATRPSGKSLDEIFNQAVTSHFQKTLKNLLDYRVEPRAEEGAPELRSLIGRGQTTLPLEWDLRPWTQWNV